MMQKDTAIMPIMYRLCDRNLLMEHERYIASTSSNALVVAEGAV